MFDFANSGYTTVVITAIFNAYFVAEIAGNAHWATLAWTATLGVSYVLIIITAPALGAYADVYACKKRVLAVTTAGCIVFTATLAAAGPGDIALAVALLIAANYCFGTGENVIAAFLPEIARGEHIGRVSGWGWGLGYLGGMATLGLCLAYVSAAQARGDPPAEFVPATLLITAGIFALAAAPTFIFLRERARPRPHRAGAIRESFARLRRTLSEARRFRDLARFLVCIVCYQAGVQAVITLAAIYAEQVMRFSTAQTITLILVVNVAAALGAVVFGYVQDRLGHKPAIAITLLGWIVMTILAAAAQTVLVFWIAANLAGICLGSSQSAGRALVGFLSPADRHGEFFGLWGLSVKLSSILGPVTYGLVVWLTAGEHRLAFALTGAYFVIGLLLLAGIDVERGRQAALDADLEPTLSAR
ncbi:MAG: MFS transporter [Betaproteobacteria bacterium]|nr:MAG: MFS transporter [Betaproteobacteria bacterium]